MGLRTHRAMWASATATTTYLAYPTLNTGPYFVARSTFSWAMPTFSTSGILPRSHQPRGPAPRTGEPKAGWGTCRREVGRCNRVRMLEAIQEDFPSEDVASWVGELLILSQKSEGLATWQTGHSRWCRHQHVAKVQSSTLLPSFPTALPASVTCALSLS